MSSTMSHPRSSKQRSSVSSTDSSESNYSESSYSPSPRNSVDHTQAPVRGPPRGSTHPTDPQAFYGRPCGRTMLDAFATAGRASASTADVPPSRRRARVSFSVEDELRFYSPSHPPNKFLKPRMVESYGDAVYVDESRLYQPPLPPKQARIREYRRPTGW